MKNKYAKRSRISEARTREVVRYFSRRPDGPSGGGPERPEPQHREPPLPRPAGTHPACLRSPTPPVRDRRDRRKPLRGAAGQGPARTRRLRQDHRLRHLRASGPSLHRDRPGLLEARAPEHHPRPGGPARRHQLRWLAGYNGLVDLGYGHFRVDHSRDEFTRGAVHVNGIEGFWGMAKARLTKFKGLPRHTFHLHLKETEWRYNHRHADKYQTLLQYLRQKPLS